MNDDTAVINAIADDDAGFRDDGLAEELAKAAPRKWWNKTTIVLGALALLVGGFVGGLQAQKQWGTSSSGSGNRAAAGFPGAGAGRYGAYGFPGGGNFGGNGTGQQGAAPTTAAAAGTTGTVKLVDGATIYVQTPDGNVVTVKTDGRTTVSTATKSKVSDVKAGQSVTVQGTTGADGTVTATSVTSAAK
jgi:hypothetical protein